MAFAAGETPSPVQRRLPAVTGPTRRHGGAIDHEHVRDRGHANPDFVAGPNVRAVGVVLCQDGGEAVVGVWRCIDRIVRRVRWLCGSCSGRRILPGWQKRGARVLVARPIVRVIGCGNRPPWCIAASHAGTCSRTAWRAVVGVVERRAAARIVGQHVMHRHEGFGQMRLVRARPRKTGTFASPPHCCRGGTGWWRDRIASSGSVWNRRAVKHTLSGCLRSMRGRRYCSSRWRGRRGQPARCGYQARGWCRGRRSR